MNVNQNLSGGLHLDNDPSGQPENTYREALNGNLITYGGNRFAFESVRGNKVSFTLPVHASGSKPFTPIGFTSFVDRLIVFSANDGLSNEANGSEIGEVTFSNDATGTYVPLYFHTGLKFSVNFPIRPKDGSIGKKETDRIGRVYFTDRNNPYRNFNFLDSRIRNTDGTVKRITSGSLVVGNKYMVLTNASTLNQVVHNGVAYGPGLTAGNIFTAVNATYTGGATVINYIPVETLDVTPVMFLPKIDGKIIETGGSLFSAAYQYVCQLITKDGGATNWGPVSRPFFVPNGNIPDSTTISYSKHKGAAITINSGKKITLTISDVDVNYTQVRVAYIRSTDFKVYEAPKIFATVDITGTPTNGMVSLEVVHAGGETTTDLSLDDITIHNPTFDRVESISSSKNISFVAGVKLANDVAFDMSKNGSVKGTAFVYPLPGCQEGNIEWSVSGGLSTHALVGSAKTPDGVTTTTTSNIVIVPGQFYKVYGTGSVTYNGTTYAVNSVFQGVTRVLALSATSGAPIVKAIIHLQKYNGLYNDTPIINDFGDYKGFLASHYLGGYWRGETYRFGIMLWSNKGFPFFVNWLCDKQMPEIYDGSDPDTGNNLDDQVPDSNKISRTAGDLINFDNTGKTASIRAMGVRFNNLDFQVIATALSTSLGTTVTVADLPKYYDGFSIVRCNRDEQIICQGQLWPIMVSSNGTDVQLMGSCQIQDDERYSSGTPNKGRYPATYTIYSPENMLGFDGRPNYQAGDKIKLVGIYDTSNNSTAAGLSTNANVDLHYYKHICPVAPTTTGGWYDKGAKANITLNGALAVDSSALGIVATNFPFTGVFNNRGKDLLNWNKGGHGIKTVLLRIDNTTSVNESTYPKGFGNQHESLRKPLVNWVREKNPTTLYGGNSDIAKAANEYIWCNHYQAFDSAFMSYLAGNSNTASGIEVMGGDCYVQMYDFGRILQVETGGDYSGATCSVGEIFVCESNINLAMREGRTFNNNKFYRSTGVTDGITEPNSDPNAPQRAEEFKVQGFYNNKENEVFYPARPANFVSQLADPNIIYFSTKKTDGEFIDTWKNIKANNFARTDSQYGNIVNIRAKATRLFYWQQKGIGYMPVQERVTTSTLAGAVQLGIGGILDRQDEIDFYYGNQHGFGLGETDQFFFWYDLNKSAMLRMGFDGSFDRNSLVKGMDSFFNTFLSSDESELSPNIFDSDNPLKGYGISSVYDNRFGLALMTFKFNKTVGGRIFEQDFTLGFTNKIDKYIGNFSFTPGLYVDHNGSLLSSKILRATIKGSTSYVVGDELFDTVDNNNYVCYVARTTPSIPTSPSVDSSHWKKSSQINQVYVNWRGDICKFFGITYPFYVSPIVKVDGTKIVNYNVEVIGNDTKFTDIVTTNSFQSASDLNIKSYDKNYRYYDGSWFFTLPLTSTKARLVDSWMQLKMSVKNYVTDPTVSTNLVKRIFMIKSNIEKKQ